MVFKYRIDDLRIDLDEFAHRMIEQIYSIDELYSLNRMLIVDSKFEEDNEYWQKLLKAKTELINFEMKII